MSPLEEVPKHPKSYEQALQELQGIQSELEGGQVSMDELPQKVARAKELLLFCHKRLRNMENDLENML